MLEPDPLVVFRGELWRADLPESIGSEPGYRRPVLVRANFKMIDGFFVNHFRGNRVETTGGLQWSESTKCDNVFANRPIQIDRFHRSKLATILAVAVRTNLALAQMPGNVVIDTAASGLEQHSVVNMTQVVTVARQFLLKRTGALPQNLLQRVEQGLKLIQGL